MEAQPSLRASIPAIESGILHIDTVRNEFHTARCFTWVELECSTHAIVVISLDEPIKDARLA